ncbi:PrsW family intramembrane metalloprotease [Streptomyces roseirectus]|uniref:PrsW family intramembrane metalloprotease n=1 Tax=Streptomyces roseirectus TaxID=2768066 RepID=A0A7H0ISX9_9ACTN|nr:PrsW family intramembrane metalloprotease [Streptomyces roseirectus]
MPPPPAPHPQELRPRWWKRPAVRYTALIALLAVSGVIILALVREQTGTQGLLVGLGLAVFPVPILVTAFRWLDRTDPAPWRNMVFAFAWGACAATLIAILANTFTTQWIANTTADPDGADTLGATLIAPVVEETAKAAAVLLVFLFRRRQFTGLVDGVVIAGTTAAGFAFTENILYLGSAFGTDQLSGDGGVASVTAATFFVRVIMSPFAHPLFTVFTGIGFGLSALTPERRRARRVLLPLTGLVLAMGMHSLWNGSAHFGPLGFFVVYGVFMVPVFGLLTWLVLWTRRRGLRQLREELPVYVAAGWLSPAEPFALSSMRARRVAREYATHYLGKPAAKTLAEYTSTATALAQLRRRGRLGHAPTDFVTLEHHLLTTLWTLRPTTRPALEYAAHTTTPPTPAPFPWHPHPTWQHPPAYGLPTGPYPPQYGGYRA